MSTLRFSDVMQFTQIMQLVSDREWISTYTFGTISETLLFFFLLHALFVHLHLSLILNFEIMFIHFSSLANALWQHIISCSLSLLLRINAWALSVKKSFYRWAFPDHPTKSYTSAPHHSTFPEISTLLIFLMLLMTIHHM